MRATCLAALILVAACTRPPPEAYTGAGPAGGQPIGTNASAEPCVLQRSAQSAVVFCGMWQQPSAQVASAGPADATGVQAIATAGPWRTAIDSRLVCASPVPTTILGGAPAFVLSCTRRSGGWPQVAMVALVGGTAYTADGIQPAAPILPRAIGVLSGTVSADAAPALPASGSDALLANRLAAQAFSAGDIGSTSN